MQGTVGARLSIIKLGGSFWNDPRLKSWIAAICELNARVIVVPGGGAFAEAVCAAQPVMQLSDAAAHRMALLAMAQYAHAICDMDERLTLAEAPEDFAESWLRRCVPVWAPSAMVSGREDIPETWDVTSDSLAAWLAGEKRATRVILVKSAKASPASMQELQTAGVVDPAFGAFMARSHAQAIWLGPDDQSWLKPAVMGEAVGWRLVGSANAGAQH